MEPSPKAIAAGPLPTGMTPVTLLPTGSIRDTVPSSEFATHTDPSPRATALGPLPVAIANTTFLVAGLIRTTRSFDDRAAAEAPVDGVAPGLPPFPVESRTAATTTATTAAAPAPRRAGTRHVLCRSRGRRAAPDPAPGAASVNVALDAQP